MWRIPKRENVKDFGGISSLLDPANGGDALPLLYESAGICTRQLDVTASV